MFATSVHFEVDPLLSSASATPRLSVPTKLLTLYSIGYGSTEPQSGGGDDEYSTPNYTTPGSLHHYQQTSGGGTSGTVSADSYQSVANFNLSASYAVLDDWTSTGDDSGVLLDLPDYQTESTEDPSLVPDSNFPVVLETPNYTITSTRLASPTVASSPENLTSQMHMSLSLADGTTLLTHHHHSHSLLSTTHGNGHVRVVAADSTTSSEPCTAPPNAPVNSKGAKKKKRSALEILKDKLLGHSVKTSGDDAIVEKLIDRKDEKLSKRRSKNVVRVRRDVYFRKLFSHAKTPYDVGDSDEESEEHEDMSVPLVKSLVKKLDKTDSLQKFAEMFDSLEPSFTPCFPITKGLDGRIQVSTRKFQPQVCYSRLFRFPGLRSSRELRCVDHCQNPFSRKFEDLVCINPYHVELIDSSPANSNGCRFSSGSESQESLYRNEGCQQQTQLPPCGPIGTQGHGQTVTAPQAHTQSAAALSSSVGAAPSSTHHGSQKPTVGIGSAHNDVSISAVLGDARVMDELMFGDGGVLPSSPHYGANAAITADLADALELIDEDRRISSNHSSEQLPSPLPAHSQTPTPMGGAPGGGHHPMGMAYAGHPGYPGTSSMMQQQGRGVYAQSGRPAFGSPGLSMMQPGGSGGAPGGAYPHAYSAYPTCSYQQQAQQQQRMMHPPRSVQGATMMASPMSGMQGMSGSPLAVLPQQHSPMGRMVTSPGQFQSPGPSRMEIKSDGSPKPNQVLPQFGPGPSTSQQPAAGQGPSAIVKEEKDSVDKKKQKDRPLKHTVSVFPHMTGKPVESSPIPPPPQLDIDSHWAHVMYYELDAKITEVYKATSESFTIDGFTATHEPGRFCLGAVGNANRDSLVTNVRRQIGRGIKITRGERGVELTVLSDSPIFIQSPTHAHAVKDNASTVYRLSNGANNSMSIFDMDAFEELLKIRMTEGYRAVYQLQNFCHARISFVKGFGSEYRRQTIQNTPCWVEIHFLQPLQRLDQALNSLETPQGATSFS